ncbi:hypothetical protein HHI36_005094 [Cryptolaemus montrouzieri]|uniref:Uncharacterized protein n=1 Tax=Cryptolaemus montrouzieri TaxID=559131 RepID=A0ABD2NTN4_9CUCU
MKQTGVIELHCLVSIYCISITSKNVRYQVISTTKRKLTKFSKGLDIRCVIEQNYIYYNNEQINDKNNIECFNPWSILDIKSWYVLANLCSRYFSLSENWYKWHIKYLPWKKLNLFIIFKCHSQIHSTSKEIYFPHSNFP